MQTIIFFISISSFQFQIYLNNQYILTENTVTIDGYNPLYRYILLDIENNFLYYINQDKTKGYRVKISSDMAPLNNQWVCKERELQSVTVLDEIIDFNGFKCKKVIKSISSPSVFDKSLQVNSNIQELHCQCDELSSYIGKEYQTAPFFRRSNVKELVDSGYIWVMHEYTESMNVFGENIQSSSYRIDKVEQKSIDVLVFESLKNVEIISEEEFYMLNEIKE